MSQKMKPDITALFEQITSIQDALKAAAADAVLRARAAGHPIAGWRDGKVVLIPADQVPLPLEPESTVGLKKAI